jgi:hypothetical protein
MLRITRDSDSGMTCQHLLLPRRSSSSGNNPPPVPDLLLCLLDGPLLNHMVQFHISTYVKVTPLQHRSHSVCHENNCVSRTINCSRKQLIWSSIIASEKGHDRFLTVWAPQTLSRAVQMATALGLHILRSRNGPRCDGFRKRLQDAVTPSWKVSLRAIKRQTVLFQIQLHGSRVRP